MSTTIERQRQVVDDSAGALVSRAFRQTAELVRKEMRLSRAEMTQKGKCYGTGGGLFPAMGVLGLFTAQALPRRALPPSPWPCRWGWQLSPSPARLRQQAR
ncbi:phage holin family protein [Streptomyces avidinii]|uniref:phage holin family protein n=1 Tax=Streptomyces avidinii TaxID=1895 RepID=UPI0037A3F0BB